jgi:uncharacterized protein DUF541
MNAMGIATLTAVGLSIPITGAAGADASAPTIAAIGSAQVGVKPANPKSEPSIRRAVEAARPQALRLALRNAREKAELFATESGLVLGGVVSVEEYQSPYGPGLVVFGRFGPNRFCGLVNRAITRSDPATGRRTVVRRVKERRCFAPPAVAASVEVTYAATAPGG